MFTFLTVCEKFLVLSAKRQVRVARHTLRTFEMLRKRNSHEQQRS